MKTLLTFISLLLCVYGYSLTTLVSQHFSSVAPTGWSSTSSVWVLNRNESATGNYRNVYDATTYSSRFSSAADGNSIYLYIPINFKKDSVYTITFYTKRACSVVINTNELPNQTTLLTNQTFSNSSCNSNWSTWYQWSTTITSTYTGTGYFQIWTKTVYGGPTSVYLDDVTITESSPVGLPIELLYFKGRKTQEGNLLQWETASENNNDYFTIYRSIYPIEWSSIVKINGAGNSVVSNKYQFLDSRIENDINYYILRQTDYDGKYKESEIIAIDNRKPYITPTKIVNMIGQEVSIDYDGLKFITYEDGSVEKVY
jgi:hypothetical protein